MMKDMIEGVSRDISQGLLRDPYALWNMPESLASLVVARDGKLRVIKGPEADWSYVDYTYANGEVVLGEPDGVNVVVNPGVDDNVDDFTLVGASVGVFLWSSFNGGSLLIKRATDSGAYEGAKQYCLEVGAYYQMSFSIYRPAGSDSTPRVQIPGSALLDVTPIEYDEWERVTKLVKATSTELRIFSSSGSIGSEFYLDDFDVQKLQIAPPVAKKSVSYTDCTVEEYENTLPTGGEDFTNGGIWAYFDLLLPVSALNDGSEGYQVLFDSVVNARVMDTLSDKTIGDLMFFDVEMKVPEGYDGKQITIEADGEASRVALTTAWKRYRVGCTLTTATPVIRIIRRDSDDTQVVHVRYPQVTDHKFYERIECGGTGQVVTEKGVYVGPGYTNEAPENSNDALTWTNGSNGFIRELIQDGPCGPLTYKITNNDATPVWARTAPQPYDFVNGKTYTVSYRVAPGNINRIKIRGSNESIQGWARIHFDTEEIEIVTQVGTDATWNWATMKKVGTYYLVTFNITITGTGESWNNQCGVGPSTFNEGEYFYCGYPMVVESSYAFPYIPPGTTQPACQGTSGGNGVSIEMSGERPDGIELWNPSTMYVDVNNYSTFDPETGIGRIVSDGAYVTLSLANSFYVGQRVRLVYEELESVVGDIRSGSFDPDKVFYDNEVYDGTLESATLTISRHSGATDVTFRLSVQALEPYISPLRECYQGEPDGVDRYLNPVKTKTFSTQYESMGWESSPDMDIGDRFLWDIFISDVASPLSFHLRTGGSYGDYTLKGNGRHLIISENDDGTYPNSIRLQVGSSSYEGTITINSVQKLHWGEKLSTNDLSQYAIYQAGGGSPTGDGSLDITDGLFTLQSDSTVSGRAQVTINDLTAGDTYEVMIWDLVSDDDEGPLCTAWDGSWGTLGSEEIPQPMEDFYFTKRFVATDATMRIGIVSLHAGAHTATFRASIKKVLSRGMTLAALVCMGVGSDEVSSYNNILSTSDNTVHGGLTYYDNGSGGKRSVGLHDGQILGYLAQEWERGEYHLKVAKVYLDDNGDLKFNVGNFKLGIDTQITWAYPPRDFDGSFGPLDFERWAYGSTTPLHIKLKANFKEVLTDDQIIDMVEYYGDVKIRG